MEIVDIHSHFLPNVDDGSKSYKQTYQMLDAAKKVGIDTVFATPHYKYSYCYPNLAKLAFKKIKPYAQEIGIKLLFGYETHWYKIDKIGVDQVRNFCLENTNSILLEYSVGYVPDIWLEQIKQIQKQGVNVVIVHPERNIVIQDNPDIAYKMKDIKCQFCMSANTLTPKYNKKTHEFAKTLLKDQMIDYIATDAHRVEAYPVFQNTLCLAKEYGFKSKNIFD